MSTHLDPDKVADLHAGLLDDEQSTLAQAHLVGCARCRADASAVTDVVATLAAAAAGPMPDAVAARVDAALAAAALADTGPTDTRPAAAGTVTPLRPGRRRDRLPSTGRLLQAAAAVVLLLGGAALAVSTLNRPDSRSDSSSASTSSSTPSGAGSRSDATGGRSQDAPGRYPVLASGTDYTKASVAAAVVRLLSTPSAASSPRPRRTAKAPASANTRASAEAAPAEPEVPVGRLAGGTALADCLVELTGTPGSRPLAVDVATFDGKPATVIVLQTPDDPSKVDVDVVGPGCRAGDAALLNFTRVTLP